MTEDILYVVLKYDIRVIHDNGVDVLHYINLPKEFVLGSGHFYRDHNGVPTTRVNFLGRMPERSFHDFINKVVEYDRTR